MVFGPIREWFAGLPESGRGYKVGRYLLTGEDAKLRGDGVLTYEMHFLPDVFIPCDTLKELDTTVKHLK